MNRATVAPDGTYEQLGNLQSNSESFGMGNAMDEACGNDERRYATEARTSTGPQSHVSSRYVGALRGMVFKERRYVNAQIVDLALDSVIQGKDIALA